MAVVGLISGKLFFYRNHERPLWFSPQSNGVLVASTSDILKRSGISNNVYMTEPLVHYSFDENIEVNRQYCDNNIEDLQVA